MSYFYSAMIHTADGEFVAQMSWTGNYADGLAQVLDTYGNNDSYVITLRTDYI